MHAIPVLLTSLRLALAPVVVALACWHPLPAAFVAILVIALLSDIFDGVIARRLGIATPALRTYDSLTDVTFYAAVLVATCVLHGHAVANAAMPLAFFLATELACNVVSLVRFGAMPATHSYAAKGLGLVFFSGFALILGWGLTTPWFLIMMLAGVAVNAEILLILVLARTRPVDVKSVFHLQRRQG